MIHPVAVNVAQQHSLLKLAHDGHAVCVPAEKLLTVVIALVGAFKQQLSCLLLIESVAEILLNGEPALEFIAQAVDIPVVL